MVDVAVPDLGVIDEPNVAAAVLDPIRARVLSSLRNPGSATTVAAALGETRQKVNYHLRALEELGLVRLVEDRPRRGLTERVMVASARAYVLSPELLGDSAVDPDSTDRLSSNYVLALAARVVREVADLARRARSGLVIEAIKTLLSEAATPLAHGVGIFAKTRDDLLVLKAVGSQKHDLGTPCQTLRRLTTPHQALQLSPLLARQVNRNRWFAH